MPLNQETLDFGMQIEKTSARVFFELFKCMQNT